jgi:hypothetical protein
MGIFLRWQIIDGKVIDVTGTKLEQKVANSILTEKYLGTDTQQTIVGGL